MSGYSRLAVYAATAMAILLAAPFVPPVAAQSAQEVREQIEEKRRELRAVNGARAVLQLQTTSLRAERNELRQDLEAVKNFAKLPDAIIASASGAIRRGEQLIARALSPVEKFKAFQAYERSDKGVEAFRKLFKTFRGVEPDRTTIQQRGIFINILDLERRKALIADVAGPLATAGKLITGAFSTLRQAQAVSNFTAKSMRNLVLVRVYKSSRNLKRGLNATTSMVESSRQAAESVREAKQKFGADAQDVQAMLKTVGAFSPEEIEKRLSVADNFLSESSDEELELAIDLADGNPKFNEIVDSVTNARAEFEALANKLSGNVRVGRAGFVENLGQSVIVKQTTQPIIDNARQIVATMEKLRARVDRLSKRYTDSFRPVQTALDQNEKAIAGLVAEENRINDEIAALRDRLFLAEIKEQKIDDVANPILTGLQIGLSGGTQIASDRFGELIGLPNRTRVAVSVQIGSLESRPCRHSCRRNAEGVMVCKQATRKVFVRRGNQRLDANGLSRLGIQIRPDGGLRISNEGGLLLVRAPGATRGTLTARAQGLKQVINRDHVCGVEDALEMHRLEAQSREVSVSRVHADEIQILGLTLNEGRDRRVDFFGDGPRRLDFRVPVTLPQGDRRERRIDGGVVVSRATGDPVATVAGEGGRFTIEPTGELGKMRMELQTAAKPGGEPLRLGAVTVTNTEFSDSLDLPEGPWNLDGDDLLPPGETARFRVKANGGVEESLLNVRWTIEGARKGQVRTNAGSRFASGAASLGLAFDPKLVFDDGRETLRRFDRREMFIRAEVLYQGRPVHNVRFDTLRLGQPILRKVQVGLRENGNFVPVRRLDFVTPRPRTDTRLGVVGVLGEFDGGAKRFLRLGELEQTVSGGQGLLDADGVIDLNVVGVLNGEVSSASTTFVSAKYEASVGPARGRSFYVLGGDKDDQFGFSLNKLTAQVVEDVAPSVVRARVIGPGRFAGTHTAVFKLSDDEIAVPLVAEGEEDIAEIEGTRFNILGIEIRDPAGRVVALLVPSIHGQILGELKIALDHPPTVTAGQVVVVSAQILNVEAKGIEGNGLRCRWTTDDAIAQFEEQVTRLEPMTVSTGFCVNILRVSEDLPQGRAVDLPVSLAIDRTGLAGEGTQQ